MNYICIHVNSIKSIFVLRSWITNFTCFPIVFPIISITINHHKSPFVPCCFPLNQHKHTSFPMFFRFHPPARAMFGIKLIANGSNLAALARRWGGIAGVVPKWVGLVIRWVKTYFNGHFRNRFIGGTYHIYVLPIFLGLCKGIYHQHIALYGTVKAWNTSSKY